MIITSQESCAAGVLTAFDRCISSVQTLLKSLGDITEQQQPTDPHQNPELPYHTHTTDSDGEPYLELADVPIRLDQRTDQRLFTLESSPKAHSPNWTGRRCPRSRPWGPPPPTSHCYWLARNNHNPSLDFTCASDFTLAILSTVASPKRSAINAARPACFRGKLGARSSA